MNFKEHQKDMRNAYLAGGTGILVSGIIWLVSGLYGKFLTKETSILIFFVGGMLIYPLGVFLAKLLKSSGKHQKNNPLAKLAIESTAILFIGLFIAYSTYQIQKLWFFPIVLMIIGVRYLVFQSIYGMKIYWILGLFLIVAGIVCVISNQPFHFGGIIGGVIELIFGVLVIVIERKKIKL
jgi:drug/metabolite transporter (DMT)-like permease